MNARILVVEDEGPIRRMVEEILRNEGYSVKGSGSAEEALAELRKSIPDLLILDIRLPGQSGFDLCRKMKETSEWKTVSLIFLTSREDQASKVAGLELGADDYVTKPFGAPELAARVKAVLRRVKGERPSGILKGGAVHLDSEKRRVTVKDKEVFLTGKEFDLLRVLLEKNGTVLARTYLLEALWSRDAEETSRTVDQHVYRLRKSLGRYGTCIESVEGIGYRWNNL